MLIGIVGKSNVGKSTFFKAITLADVEIANRPFVTIAPNRGVGYVKVDCVDREFNVRCNPRIGYCVDNNRFVAVDLLDVAGLIPGSHKGEGLGNQFLNDLNQADALIHIIDASGSTNERGELVEAGSYDPINDIKFLENELDMWYLGIIKKGWERFSRQVQQERSEISKAVAKQLSGLRVDENIAQESIVKLKLDSKQITSWDDSDLLSLASELRKRTKPMLIAANKIDIGTSIKNIDRLKKEFPDYIIIPCSAESELALKEANKHGLIKYIPGDSKFEVLNELNEKQKKALEFIKINILDNFKTTGVQDALDKAVFELLEYMAIFPGGVNKLSDQYGNILPDCFLLPKNSTALDFAFRIHTDIGNNFIKAINVKTKIPVGKDYKLKHREVIEIMAKK